MDFTIKSIRESWIEKKNMLVFTFYDPHNPVLVVDVFVRELLPFAELSDKAIMLDIGGELVPVCDIESLITMKKKAGRTKDLEDIKYLRAIFDEQEQNSK